MTRIKYDNNLLKYMLIFESITRTKLKDVIEQEDKMIFIVNKDNISRAIGKRGANVKFLESKFKKKVKIVEFDDDAAGFVGNFIYPLVAKNISVEEGIISIEGPDTKTKALLIGRNSRNLNFLKSVVKRYHKIEDIKVL